MKISLNKIKQYVQVPSDVSDEELIKLIGSRLVEVEEVIDLAPKYRGSYIVKVVSCDAIPETHLHLCQIDAGEKSSQFNQLDNGLIQVVCGAPNVHAGMLAVWITPGSIVPTTYGHENFRLSVRKLRGYESNGMLAGADELDFDNEHKSIAEIDPKIAKPGDELAKIFNLNDLILDVENKSLTHRPDCFGLIGFAREVAGILGVEFVEPPVFSLERFSQPLASTIKPQLNLKVEIMDSQLCPRYTCAVFDLPNNTPSKYLTKEAVFLAKSGMRSIDPIVDLTNILMLETGQPLHAFDYDKLVAVGDSKTPKIIIRAAMAEEEIQLLDGKTISCIKDDILITSNNVPVALAGAMGGKNTEVDASTKRIVLESATFSLYNLRKTQMAHGIFSEAITRFTKGQPAAITNPVLVEAINRLKAEPLVVVDNWAVRGMENVVKITTQSINELLGTSYESSLIAKTLTNVGFRVKDYNETLEIIAPEWRTDIHLPEDIIEEVGRLLGYDNVPLSLPLRPFVEPEIDPMLQLKSTLRTALSDNLRMHEVLTYSFVSRSLLEKAGQDPANSYEIVNSISPELQCFRQQISPSLIEKTRDNLKAGHTDFALYEVNQVASRADGLTDEGIPFTKAHLAIALVGDFYLMKANVLTLLRDLLKLDVSYAKMSPTSAKIYPYLEPGHSVDLFLGAHQIGSFGELRPSIAAQFKLSNTVSALELDLDQIVSAPETQDLGLTFSKFPAVERDLTLKVSHDLAFGRVLDSLHEFFDHQNLIYHIQPTSIYQPSLGSSTKNLSFHLDFSAPEKTLKTSEISDIMEGIKTKVSQVGAEIV